MDRVKVSFACDGRNDCVLQRFDARDGGANGGITGAGLVVGARFGDGRGVLMATGLIFLVGLAWLILAGLRVCGRATPSR